MKLTVTGIETNFIFDGRINILVIEDGKTFREYAEQLKKQIDGGEGAYVLINDEKSISLSKNSVLIDSFLNLDIVDKKLINKLYGFLSEIGDDKFQVEVAKLNEDMYALFDKLNAECDIPIDYDTDTSLADLFKNYGVRIQCECSSFLDRLTGFIDALIYLSQVKVLFFINLCSFLSEKELIEFYRYIKLKQLPILLLESNLREKIDDEYIVLIDRDLCEIVV